MDKSSDEEEEDLYSDLPNFKYDETIDKLQGVNKELLSRIAHLENEFQNQTKELEQCRYQCEILTKNISSLLKTAQNEIKRKDQKINELNKTVLELKTEVLKSRKRAYNGFCDETKQPYDEGQPLKRQKLQDDLHDATVPPHHSTPKFSRTEAQDKPLDDREEPPEPDRSKQVAPEIKCHTLYSQRMYNKIYNIDSKDIASSPGLVTVDKTEEADIDTGRDEEKNNSIKKIMPPCAEQNQDTNNLLTGTRLDESCKTDLNMVTSILFSDDLKDDHRSLSLNSQKNFQNECNDKDTEPKVISSKHYSTKISKETVNPPRKILSLLRDRTLNSSVENEVLETTDCIKEKKVIISRVNRSVNFSRTENVSQAVHVQHYGNKSAVETCVVDEKKISNVLRSDCFNKINVITDTNQEKVNSKKILEKEGSGKSQLVKSHLSKFKKTTKNIISPISRSSLKMSKTISSSKKKDLDCAENEAYNKPVVADEPSNKNEPIVADESANKNEHILVDESTNKNEKEKLDIMEALFGSPLRWTENSMDDVRQTKLSFPANAFEDSCSAHIENVKFKVDSNITPHSSSITKTLSRTERKCSFQPSVVSELKDELPSFDNEGRPDVPLSKDSSQQPSSIHWPFSRTNNEIPSKNRTVTSPTFATFVSIESTSEACDVPSTLRGDSTDNANVPVKFLKSAKYNDSVLGQFDDTTQLINALAKDPSKLSPIRTPVKEGKEPSTGTSPVQTEKAEAEVNEVPVPSLASLDGSISLVKEVVTSNSTPMCQVSSEKKTPPPHLTRDKKGKILQQTSPSEKKICIPASLISTVQKKLSIPMAASSPVEKKVEKKTILLDKPINILCPRKTPRQVGKPKQNVTLKKQSQVPSTAEKTTDKTVNNSHDEIKSPSPANGKSLTNELCSKIEIASPCATKNHKSDESIKTCKRDERIRRCTSNSEEKSRTSKSKSPSQSSHKSFRETVHRDKIIDDKRRIHLPRVVPRRGNSHIRMESHYSPSRKEKPSRRTEYRSPSRKENSPLRYKRPLRRDLDPKIFIRPQPRRESFRRPNCKFRQCSVDRKIAKDYRHSSKSRTLIPSRTNKICETSRSSNSTSHNKDRLISSKPSKIPVISRSSRISWSATSVVSARPVRVNSNDNGIRSPSPEIKWVLRPIDFDTPNYAKHYIKTDLKNSVKKPSTTAEDSTIPPSPSPSRERSFLSPEPSPAKSIVIVAEKRPVKFGSNN